MKVLVAIDGSPHSEIVLRWVRTASWPPGARFLLISVSPVTANAYAAVEPGGGKFLDDLQREDIVARHEGVDDAKRELQRAGLRVESRVGVGDPRDLILRTAESERVDLIVIGSHGLSGVARLLIGSVAGHVATHAPCNVVIVRTSGASVAR
jgi:nucleotide-binding universal stress UspA family protein